MSDKSLDLNYSHRSICGNHNNILHIIKKLKSISSKLKEKDEKLDLYIDILKDRTEKAKKQGKKMEKRLKQYRKGVENLGFSRCEGNGTNDK